MIVVIDPDAESRTAMTAVLTQLGDVAELASPDRFADEVATLHGTVDSLFVGPNVDLERALKIADLTHDVDSATQVVIVARRVTREVLRSAMRAGACDVIPISAEEDEMLEVAGRAAALAAQWRATHGAPDASPSRSRVTVVFSTKGGSGKSFVSTNLAVLAAGRPDQSVALVDLDLESGDLAIMLQVLPAWTIHEAVEQIERLDEDALMQFMTPHRSGVHLLAAPAEPALAEEVPAEAVEDLLDMLRGMFDHVIVDCPAAFTEPVLVALDEADDIVLVASLDVPSIKSLKLGLSTLQRLGIPRERVHVVVNRADSNVGLRLREVEKVIDTPIDVTLPSSRDVPLSVNEGVPLVIKRRRSPVAKALAELEERLATTTTTTSRPQRAVTEER